MCIYKSKKEEQPGTSTFYCSARHQSWLQVGLEGALDLSFLCSPRCGLHLNMDKMKPLFLAQLKFPCMGSPGRESTLGQGGDRSAGFDSSAETRQRF